MALQNLYFGDREKPEGHTKIWSTFEHTVEILKWAMSDKERKKAFAARYIYQNLHMTRTNVESITNKKTFRT
jgi:hypothetical protein